MKGASYAPIYAAAIYPDMAELFRSHGYALAVHGSLARDLDLVAIPWVEVPAEPQVVVDDLLKAFDIRQIGATMTKCHGRLIYTISVGHGCCALDLSFMPCQGGT